MNLLEYEAKNILSTSGIPVPQSKLISHVDQSLIQPPVVLKSQVPVGGRGKLGGIRIVKQEGDVNDVINSLLHLPIKGYTPSTLLAEEELEIDRELYLAILINRVDTTVEIVAHRDGGMEVESNDYADFLHIALDGNNDKIAGEQLAEYYGLESHSFALQDMIKNLYQCFIKNDATLIEINPLILTKQNKLVAGDCKMILDDAARFRHPEWQFETTAHDANFVVLNPEGTVATVANGAGLAMATVDAVVDGGMTPANFLDIGGGASTETVLAAFKRIVEFSNVQAIVINIFAGITRCDEVAKAILAAREQITNLPPLFIRLAGTNYEAAADILAEASIQLLPTLDACIASAKEAINE